MKELLRQLSPLQRFFVVVSAGLLITLTTGFVCGQISQRWGPAPDTIAAARHLEQFPEQISHWKMVTSDRMSDIEIQTLMCAGYVNRTYVNQSTGEEVSLAIIVGPSGPTAVHTPEICYSSQAYSIETPPEAVKVSDQSGIDHRFWRTVFRSTDPTGEQLCVYHAWTADGKWLASESPRFEFAGAPMLFKLQMASPLPPGRADESNPCHRFLTELLNAEWKVTEPSTSDMQKEAT